MMINQGIVTYMSQVEAFATGIKMFDRQKVCLIVPFWSFWSLDFQWVKVKLLPCVLNPLIFAVWRSPWSLDWLSKRTLIAWFNFDPVCKRFYTGHISDVSLTNALTWDDNVFEPLIWAQVATLQFIMAYIYMDGHTNLPWRLWLWSQ